MAASFGVRVRDDGYPWNLCQLPREVRSVVPSLARAEMKFLKD